MKHLMESVNIFSSDHEILPQPPLGPFMCTKNIKLSADELKLLSRGPKFMIREDLSRENHQVDVEKMIVKQKYENCFSEKEDDSQNELQHQNKQPQTKPTATNEVFLAPSNRVKSDVNDFECKWEEKCGEMLYNNQTKTLDMGNMRATNYKYNKYVGLPPNESPEIETTHHNRRIELLRVFDRVKNDPEFKEPGSESNLSKDELNGLKSLKKKRSTPHFT